MPALPRTLIGLTPAETIMQSLTRLELTTDLQYCLDAGDIASFASGQKWLDVSGNGQDFFLGANGSAGADDPTFNGTPGNKTAAEYFSFAGGAFFTYDTANEPWMEQIHKAEATITLALLFEVGALTATQYLAATANNQTTTTGFAVPVSTSGAINFNVLNGSGSAMALTHARTGIAPLKRYFYLVSIDEAAGPDGSFSLLNGAIVAFDGAYQSPSSGAAQGVMRIGGRPSGTSSLLAGSRMYGAIAWSRALSQAEAARIYGAVGPRLGI